MSQTPTVQLSFTSKHAELRQALSAVVCTGNTLWAANDETTSLERFTLLESDDDNLVKYGKHRRFPLKDYLQLPLPPKNGEEGEEVDIEGLDYADGYLWLTGSHSLSRSKPDENDSPQQAFQKLATVKRGSNHFLLARIPAIPDKRGVYRLHHAVRENGEHCIAAHLQTDRHGDELTKALRSDPHLQAFLDLPGKDNGFDIEGLAVNSQQVFLGLRGPVLRGWACILELQPVADRDDPSRLKLTEIGPNGQLYRKHFLKMDGLGIRDLCIQNNDLLILAGPTMSAEGPMRIFRWQGGANPEEENVVERKALSLLLDMPASEDDHPEGICLFPPDSDKPDLLAVYDPAGAQRLPGKKTVSAGRFVLED